MKIKKKKEIKHVPTMYPVCIWDPDEGTTTVTK